MTSLRYLILSFTEGAPRHRAIYTLMKKIELEWTPDFEQHDSFKFMIASPYE